jgi:hypothetical protein
MLMGGDLKKNPNSPAISFLAKKPFGVAGFISWQAFVFDSIFTTDEKLIFSPPVCGEEHAINKTIEMKAYLNILYLFNVSLLPYIICK